MSVADFRLVDVKQSRAGEPGTASPSLGVLGLLAVGWPAWAHCAPVQHHFPVQGSHKEELPCLLLSLILCSGPISHLAGSKWKIWFQIMDRTAGWRWGQNTSDTAFLWWICFMTQLKSSLALIFQVQAHLPGL